MTLTKNLDIWPDFIELCERRNLFTHTGGVISDQYIKVCRQHGCIVEGQTPGQTLQVDRKYYDHAVEVVLEFGAKLVQVIWRKLLPEDINAANSKLNRFCYNLITRRKYKLAAKLLRFGLVEMKNHGTEKIRKMMVVNYANAEKLSGNAEASEKILDKEDWTAATDDFKICVAAVRDDLDTVIMLMPRVVSAELMKIEAFREWPVFERTRAQSKFIEAFERGFGQKLLAEREGVKSRDNTMDSGIEPGGEDNVAMDTLGDTIH